MLSPCVNLISGISIGSLHLKRVQERPIFASNDDSIELGVETTLFSLYLFNDDWSLPNTACKDGQRLITLLKILVIPR